ncbi:alpha/beta hydrolase [Micromonospora sp. WMMD1082]|uniref:alpha/beta fold hydrolase n=1 Tax=Micromonospora sp. WMMD1082 TaxID=3016104 RepID=UPI002415F026|nr:alpha/beta hydrolase [Micromonospora sp. WMMD1082]MDG4796864.1 alpha/beta hydrolase [Micromonospora sp. WMMD1082]
MYTTAPLVLLPGLTFDHRLWDPLRRELATRDPGRQVLALDLPGHGDAPRRDSYPLTDVADQVHEQVTAAGVDEPVLVGHSISGIIATIYAARFGAAGVVNLDQFLLPGGFGDTVRAAEPKLRGPDWREVWDGMLAGMHIELLPPAAQDLVRTTSEPRSDLLLGYWAELLTTPAAAIRAEREEQLDAIRERGIPYRLVTSSAPPEPYLTWLRSRLPALSLTVLPDSGHFPHLAHPATLAAILTNGRA